MKTKTKAKAAAAKKQPKETSAEIAAPKAAEYQRERREIAVDLLKVAPWNPRGKITPESVSDLVKSIGSLGVIQPLVAMLNKDNNATLIAGHRRLVAAKLAGLKSVPCDILKGVDEATARRMTFIENLQRMDADPLLESELVGSLVKSGMKQDEIAAETGRGREWVARRLNLSRLSKSWRKRVKDGEQITTDCLEHVAAYPEEVQERLKSARAYNSHGALRWCDIESQFDRETQDLKKAVFDRTPCKTCPNNTGCSPDLFDWDSKPAAFGKCMDGKCFKRKVAEAIKTTIADAKANGAEVRESKQHPDYSISLQSKPDKKHNTLYVWKDWNGETVMQWGEKPKTGQTGGGMTDEEKELRKLKIAANKARRKLAEWCASGALAKAIMELYDGSIPVVAPFAFQHAFGLGAYRFSGSVTSIADASYACIQFGNEIEVPELWAKAVAEDIGATLGKEWGLSNAKRLLGIFSEARNALTEDERNLLIPYDELIRLQDPKQVKWAEDGETADDAEEPEDGEEE